MDLKKEEKLETQMRASTVPDCILFFYVQIKFTHVRTEPLSDIGQTRGKKSGSCGGPTAVRKHLDLKAAYKEFGVSDEEAAFEDSAEELWRLREVL